MFYWLLYVMKPNIGRKKWYRFCYLVLTVLFWIQKYWLNFLKNQTSQDISLLFGSFYWRNICNHMNCIFLDEWIFSLLTSTPVATRTVYPSAPWPSPSAPCYTHPPTQREEAWTWPRVSSPPPGEGPTQCPGAWLQRIMLMTIMLISILGKMMSKYLSLATHLSTQGQLGRC